MGTPNRTPQTMAAELDERRGSMAGTSCYTIEPGRGCAAGTGLGLRKLRWWRLYGYCWLPRALVMGTSTIPFHVTKTMTHEQAVAAFQACTRDC